MNSASLKSAISSVDSGGPKEPCIRWDMDPPGEGAFFWGGDSPSLLLSIWNIRCELLKSAISRAKIQYALVLAVADAPARRYRTVDRGERSV